MNNNWNVNNRDRRGWGGQRARGGRGRGPHRGSWPGNNFRDVQMPYEIPNRGFRGGNSHNFGNRLLSRKWHKKPKGRQTPGNRLSEEDIGVTEYMSDHEGFNGIIKCRYSDFQVAEINENGEIAKLTNQSPPEPPPEETFEEDEDLVLSKYNLEILPLDTWDRINNLVVNPPTDEYVEVDVTGMTKAERTRIHDAVKKAFGPSIVGSTVAMEDKKFVRFEKFKKGVRRDNRVKWVWPTEYVHFILHKENCDTMDAAARIADKLKLNVKPSMLGYAGTKDRRAKTTQWFSLRKVDPRKIAAAANEVRDVYVGNFSFSNVNLRLGMLKGNKFRIALRNVTAPENVISEAFEQLKTNGFINYYGLQRFGTRAEIPTYEIGLKLLQCNFREAVNYILEDRENTRGFFSRVTIGETRLQRALKNNPRDLLGALDQLPRNQRILYLHAYQSLVWNRCVSRRLRLFGKKPVAGDLVPLEEVHGHSEDDEEDVSEDEDKEDRSTEESNESTVTEPDKEDEEVADKIDGDKKECFVNEEADKNDAEIEEPDKKDAIKEVPGNKDAIKEVTDKKEPKMYNQFDEGPKMKVPVKVLTDEDVASGRYTIFDIVMPVPGHNIEYPPNMRDYYKELIEKDNLTLEMNHKHKSYTLSGAYRHVVVRPGDLEWRTVRYNQPFSDLLLSDLQDLNGITDTGIVEDGKFNACILTMTLPASSYATMALRELLKVNTSNDSQAQQNNYFKNKSNEEITVAEQNKESDITIKEEKVEDGTAPDAGNNEAEENGGGQCESVIIKVEKRKLEDEEQGDVKKKRDETDMDSEK